ncbi:MAG: A24 family peptidase [Corynebacterium sp.]|uniref:prepilin peptidase n=1 Tax=Corynebacterium sp. TaxID=1720 RepID=UPI0026DDC297|nr:A24 family peptidase [Corynebacterium sp.]MDO5097797.1 A24 family peptidase [Corynebacterium sp.]
MESVAVVGLYIACCSWAIALSWWDLRHYRLPNFLVVPGVVVIVVLAVLTGQAKAILGGLVWSGLYFLSHIVAVLLSAKATGGIGGGDIKLALVTGTLIGKAGLVPVFGAVLLAQLLSIGSAVIANRWLRKTPVTLEEYRENNPAWVGTSDVINNDGSYYQARRLGRVKVPHGPAMLVATAVVMVLCPEARIFSP